MPRKVKHPLVYVALSPTALATAFGIDTRHIYAAITMGQLEVRHLPGSVARRIWIADAERWYREHWLPAKPKQRKKDVSNG